MKISKDQALAALLVILSLITLGNAFLSTWNYYHFKHQVKYEHREFRHVTTTNCEEIELVKEAVRATIEQAQRFTKSSPVRTPAEKKASEEYYTDVLKRFKAKDCSRGGESPLSKNSSKRSSATPRQSPSGKHRSSTPSSGPASSPSSTVPTTR